VLLLLACYILGAPDFVSKCQHLVAQVVHSTYQVHSVVSFFSFSPEILSGAVNYHVN
jgi:hypothetical protein